MAEALAIPFITVTVKDDTAATAQYIIIAEFDELDENIAIGQGFEAGYYRFVPTLPAGYIFGSDAVLPVIQITISVVVILMILRPLVIRVVAGQSPSTVEKSMQTQTKVWITVFFIVNTNIGAHSFINKIAINILTDKG